MESAPAPFPFGRGVLSAPQQIVAAIKEAIGSGLMAPGDRLPSEVELAQQFGVSRPTVREALNSLKAAHILVSERGRRGGYRVSELSLQSLAGSVSEFISLSLVVERLTPEQLFEVRRALEVFAAGAAAARRTDAEFERLSAALPDADARPLDLETALSADAEFHRLLGECSHNPLVVGLTTAMADAYRPLVASAPGAMPPNQILAELPEILSAVAAGDAKTAREAMSRHLDYFALHFRVDAATVIDDDAVEAGSDDSPHETPIRSPAGE